MNTTKLLNYYSQKIKLSPHYVWEVRYIDNNKIRKKKWSVNKISVLKFYRSLNNTSKEFLKLKNGSLNKIIDENYNSIEDADLLNKFWEY